MASFLLPYTNPQYSRPLVSHETKAAKRAHEKYQLESALKSGVSFDKLQDVMRFDMTYPSDNIKFPLSKAKERYKEDRSQFSSTEAMVLKKLFNATSVEDSEQRTLFVLNGYPLDLVGGMKSYVWWDLDVILQKKSSTKNIQELLRSLPEDSSKTYIIFRNPKGR